MAAYFFKMNKCFWHWALFLWQPQNFMSIGCLSNTVAMVTVTRFLRKIIANLIDKICYYASHMNYPFLKDSQKLWFLTLFKCVLLNIEPNVVRSLLPAGGPFYIFTLIVQRNKNIYGPGHAKTCLMPYANNKGADQPAHPRSLISTFVVRFLDSMICILAMSKVLRF